MMKTKHCTQPSQKAQLVIVFIIFAALGLVLSEQLSYIMLGAALIFWAPFIVMERFALPFVRRYQNFAVVLGILVSFLGCVCLFIAFKM